MSLRGLLPLLGAQPSYNQVLQAVRKGAQPWVVGPAGSEKASLLATLADDLELTASGTVLVVTPSRDAADRLHDDLITFLPELEGRLVVYPQWSVGPEGGRPSPEIAGERLAVPTRLLDGAGTWGTAPAGALRRAG